MIINGISRQKLIELRDEINIIIDLTEKYRDISQSSDIEIVQVLYIEKGNLNEIIEALNASGFKVPSVRDFKNYSSNDVSEILESNDDIDLGKLAKSFIDIIKVNEECIRLLATNQKVRGLNPLGRANLKTT